MSQNTEATPLVAVIMGSQSDWNVMKNAVDTLEALGILCEAKILSAHRTPDAALKFAVGLQGRGVEVLIAAAGGAAHLAGVMAAHTMIPVLGVPMESKINGLDSLLATVQMPGGIPVASGQGPGHRPCRTPPGPAKQSLCPAESPLPTGPHR